MSVLQVVEVTLDSSVGLHHAIIIAIAFNNRNGLHHAVRMTQQQQFSHCLCTAATNGTAVTPVKYLPY